VGAGAGSAEKSELRVVRCEVSRSERSEAGAAGRAIGGALIVLTAVTVLVIGWGEKRKREGILSVFFQMKRVGA